MSREGWIIGGVLGLGALWLLTRDSSASSAPPTQTVKPATPAPPPARPRTEPRTPTAPFAPPPPSSSVPLLQDVEDLRVLNQTDQIIRAKVSRRMQAQLDALGVPFSPTASARAWGYLHDRLGLNPPYAPNDENRLVIGAARKIDTLIRNRFYTSSTPTPRVDDRA